MMKNAHLTEEHKTSTEVNLVCLASSKDAPKIVVANMKITRGSGVLGTNFSTPKKGINF